MRSRFNFFTAIFPCIFIAAFFGLRCYFAFHPEMRLKNKLGGSNSAVVPGIILILGMGLALLLLVGRLVWLKIDRDTILLRGIFIHQELPASEIRDIRLLDRKSMTFGNTKYESLTIHTTENKEFVLYDILYWNMPAIKTFLQQSDDGPAKPGFFKNRPAVAVSDPSTFSGNFLLTLSAASLILLGVSTIWIAKLLIPVATRGGLDLLFSCVILTLVGSGLFLLSSQLCYFRLEGDQLQIRNHVWPGYKKYYPLTDMAGIVIEQPYNRSVALRIRTRDFRSKAYSAASLRTKHWQALYENLKELKIPVVSEIYMGKSEFSAKLLHLCPAKISKCSAAFLGLELQEVKSKSEIFSSRSKGSFLLNGEDQIVGLNLWDSNIKKLDFLAKLPDLRYLGLGLNWDCNFAGLSRMTNLEELSLSHNDIEDPGFLSGLTNLKVLSLEGNKIADLSFVKDLFALESLSLNGNQVKDGKYLSDKSGLNSLELRDNRLSDHRFLTSLTRLALLDLGGNDITKFDFLTDFRELTVLYLSRTNLTDISFLYNLPNLLTLELSGVRNLSFGFLSEFTNLLFLYLNDTNLSDCGFLESLTNMLGVELNANRISDISFMRGWKDLARICIANNQVSDLSVLEGLDNLTKADLTGNQITDIRPLLKFVKRASG
ncbi:leucine-rich repeat domain-containing protein [Puia sp. P3]|uniref:leucine-rich repeat domain-containing protein n=1 Tax=Puia sp. P3 TaxID=3423952 RepID=UPI003D66928A